MAPAAPGYGGLRLVLDLARPSNYLTPSNLAYLCLAAIVKGAGLGGHDLLARSTTPVDVVPVLAVVTARNLVLCLAVYSTWHYFLYQRQPPISDQKIRKEMPRQEQHERDRRFTLTGSVIASVMEVCVLAHPSTTFYPAARIGSSPRGLAWLVLAFVLGGLVSDVHFYVVHRALHPWNTGRFDAGRWLYRHVHSSHHASPNPGPWSGLAMHPVEHLLYFSRMGLALVVPLPHVVFLFVVLRAIVGPAPGHHGYADKLGSRFHYLHHAKFSCNYGTRGYIDRYLGTFVD